ncbi:anaerobic glycerol-3-phosphate dehydrogenase subunit B [Halonotius aquaticus]|uniref:Anaerobic glycerol-3-phosphate dehydrogenase subunit B n=1 Tax=Halonotius aquaticus TaxID=2216978 RepID=A0A3A6PSU1_9EURY|nr:glycerol-3-phosphate dehydrogenase subunit GlpB [Halonotius aquaticus]RJX43581.1 anaerobic glycerol-3-phosphate dehydrogenase subunit B [Halonotius aquaticus]
MAIREDVIVIGGGLAGSMAALEAADGDASVRLITHKKSTLRHASGLIDVLGYLDEEEPVADPFAAISELPDDHPYSIAGEAAIRDGLARFDEAVGDTYLGSHTDSNALLPTFGGAVKPTARYPAAAAAGLASDSRDMLIVGFEELTEYNAGMLADHLDAADVPFDVEGVELNFPGEYAHDSRVTRFAKRLDINEDVDHDGQTMGARQALADAVAPHVGDAERVGFPAFLGDDHTADVRADLERELGVDVFEIPMGPPSFPGMRLADQLKDALDDAGVHISAGNPVINYEADGDEIEAVIVDSKGREVPYHAEEFILATGGLVGKGIDSDRDGTVEEPIFDCHIPHSDDRYDWFDEEAFGNQPFAHFGVRIDEGMRPLDADGEPEFANLRAAGGVVGGTDPVTEKSQSGISLTTAAVAGQRARERAAKREVSQ